MNKLQILIMELDKNCNPLFNHASKLIIEACKYALVNNITNEQVIIKLINNAIDSELREIECSGLYAGVHMDNDLEDALFYVKKYFRLNKRI